MGENKIVLVKCADDMTFGAMLNNDLERSLLRECLIARAMGGNKQYNFSEVVCAVSGGQVLEREGTSSEQRQ